MIKFAFFGGEPLAVPTLQKLKEAGMLPSLVVCNPDRPSGRGQQMTHPPAKVWAEAEGIQVYQPTTYKDGLAKEKLSTEEWDLFVVVAYNFILPSWLLELPKHGVVNVHPSLLPKLRGASPIRSAILQDEPEAVGVSVMLLDAEMDHGPILAQQKLLIARENWPMSGPELDTTLAEMGGKLLVETIPEWVSGKISPQEQNHSAATYCHKLKKEEAELMIDPFELPAGEAGRHTLHVINAYAGIGDAFFIHKERRVKVKKAEFAEGKLRLLRVTPEGKKEVDFTDYLRNL
ncbi:MAG: methionyl-tRNA formyltransferase [Candidatus Pacebacteria bacterium]|nr:methionyl-tRNA formyltransferase [Candidatus Paceibacterota bacterium]